MNKNEEQLALELDAFLTAHLQQRPLPPVDEQSQDEAKLALDLFALAQTMEPAPVFLSDLEAQLAAAASRQPQKINPPKRPEPSFWQNFINNLKEPFTMKRTIYALGGLAAVIIIGVVAWTNFGGRTSEPDMIASSNTPISETVPGTTTQPETAVTAAPTTDFGQPAATPDLSSLPRLPQMGTGNRGMGGGGMGGGGEASVPAVEEAIVEGDMPIEPGIGLPWNPLADANFSVNAPFPTEPGFAAVYQQPASNSFTMEEIQRLAQLFGVTGPIYQEIIPEPVYEQSELEAMPEIRPWTPPNFYYIFDGQRQVSFYENFVYYFNMGASQAENLEMMPYAQAAPIVEAFLRERGLLNFPYITASFWGNDVEIRRVVNGYVSTSAEFYVSVTSTGEIMSITYQPFDKLQPLGDYPLRSAADAWQYVMDNGFDYMTSYWITYPGPDFAGYGAYMEEPVTTPWEEIYRYWPRTLNDGDAMTLISYPIVYVAVNGDAPPRIMVEQYLLSGATADLEALAKYAGQPVRIEGIVRGQMPNMSIELTAWRPEPDHMWQFMPGTIRYDGTQVLFDADEGETFVVPNPPADLADGERVNLSGWSLEETGGPFRSFNWSSIDRIVNWEELPTEITNPTPVEPVEEYKLTDITITEITLVYQFSPTFGEDGNLSMFLMQPAWRFKGTTNTNEIIEIMVQAVAPEFVESNGQ